jgi:hypothetical protein
MDFNTPRGNALALEPVTLSTPGGDAARAVSNASSANSKPKRDLGITTADEFLAAAADEYQKGRIDQALWRRVADQCDDASLVIAAYLRARATALHQKQDEYLQRQTRRLVPVRGASEQKVEPEPRLEIMSAKVGGIGFLGVQPKLKYLAAVAAALASVAVVVWLAASPWQSEPVAQPIVSAARPSLNRSTPPIPLASEQALVKSTSGGTDPGGEKPALETTVQQLKNEGKWNVLVLFASEWTRKDPNNAAARY